MKVPIYIVIVSTVFSLSCGGPKVETECNSNDPLCIDMIHIEGGEFTMGTDEGGILARPAHQVTVPSFRMLSTEVTRYMYKPCIDEGVCAMTGDDFELESHPVGYISWDDTQIYIKWLNDKYSTNYRLPSESEWEYAARAGTTTEFYWGDTDDCTKGNISRSDCVDDDITSVPVKSYPKNAFGLFDMTGNVWEWVQDCRFVNGDYSSTPTDGSAQEGMGGFCETRGCRGGSWVDGFVLSTNWFRNSDSPNIPFNYFGFRLVHDLE